MLRGRRPSEANVFIPNSLKVLVAAPSEFKRFLVAILRIDLEGCEPHA